MKLQAPGKGQDDDFICSVSLICIPKVLVVYKVQDIVCKWQCLVRFK
jgi:hypothetical protein